MQENLLTSYILKSFPRGTNSITTWHLLPEKCVQR